MPVRYPPLEPYAHGLLDVGDGNRIYWEACGNPEGRPALVVHGGPGSGCRPGHRRHFDPERYRIILFDQRNCGRSLPHAADHGTDLTHNTTDHLIADMELLREHLGVQRWLLYGGSWGSTLILAYAERHPERVSEIVITGVTSTRRSEIDWLYRGVGAFFPRQWEQFRDALPEADRGDVVAGYARLMNHPDQAVRVEAAEHWCRWEDTVLSLEPAGVPNPYGGRPARDRLALVRICSHYFSHGAWLEEGVLIREVGRLKGIPGVLIHGQLDLGSPLITAWELAKGWPDARLVVIGDSGHQGNDAMFETSAAAVAEFGRG